MYPKLHPFKKTILLFASVVVTGCSFSYRTVSKNKYWLPADFNPATTVSLIQQAGSKRQVARMEVFMQKNYPYKYVIIPVRDAAGAKYSDRNTYGFFMASTLGTPNYNFNFYDRLKKYPISTEFERNTYCSSYFYSYY